MRLIDADALVEEIRNSFPMGGTRGVFLAFVDNAPTAYDVERVVEQLKKLKDTDTREVYLTHHIDCDEAIYIVREGV